MKDFIDFFFLPWFPISALVLLMFGFMYLGIKIILDAKQALKKVDKKAL